MNSDSQRPHWVLVHSPIVGPLTWSLVAEELERRGSEVTVPELAHEDEPDVPFWTLHARSVACTIADLPVDAQLILAGHSGAGPVLPAIGRETSRQVAAYLFVDAGLPMPGQKRIGGGQFERYLRDLYAAGARFPNWIDSDLHDIVPDPNLRQRLLAELRPQSLAFWEDVLPVVDGWPDAPCGYLQFTSAYDGDADRAEREGWPVRRINAEHFHMLVDPPEVAASLISLVDQMGSSLARP